jgi:uncharacterized membrane protein
MALKTFSVAIFFLSIFLSGILVGILGLFIYYEHNQTDKDDLIYKSHNRFFTSSFCIKCHK